jgi:hypothetical protein
MKGSKLNLSAEQRELRRQQAMERKPWLKSTGPRTPEGLAKSSKNGRKEIGGKTVPEWEQVLSAENLVLSAIQTVYLVPSE